MFGVQDSFRRIGLGKFLGWETLSERLRLRYFHFSSLESGVSSGRRVRNLRKVGYFLRKQFDNLGEKGKLTPTETAGREPKGC